MAIIGFIAVLVICFGMFYIGVTAIWWSGMFEGGLQTRIFGSVMLVLGGFTTYFAYQNAPFTVYLK